MPRETVPGITPSRVTEDPLEIEKQVTIQGPSPALASNLLTRGYLCGRVSASGYGVVGKCLPC
jgi:hypothetical protein